MTGWLCRFPGAGFGKCIQSRSGVFSSAAQQTNKRRKLNVAETISELIAHYRLKVGRRESRAKGVFDTFGLRMLPEGLDPIVPSFRCHLVANYSLNSLE